MADISQVKLPNGDTYNLVDETSGYITTSIYSGTCASAAADTTKIVACSDFTDLKAGAAILVTFNATNTAAVGDLTLNVNNTGAKKIQYINNGTRGNLSSAGYLKASTTYLFVYDGTYWVAYFNYNTTYSSMTDAEITAGTGTTARTITPVRLKTAVETWAPVTSVNGQTGAVTIAVPSNTSDLTNDSGYITSQYIENKTDYSIPVSRVGEIEVGETAIGTDSTNFPTSKAVVDYVDERVVQEMDAIDVGVISVNGKTGSVTLSASDVGAAAISQIPTSTSQLTNDSGFITASDIPTTDLSGYMQKGVDYVTAGQKSGTTLGTKATAEGYNNTASGVRSHAEGANNTSSGSYSHAEGYYTTASGDYSHVEGRYTIAQSVSQHVFGQYNIADTQGSNQAKGTYVEIVGNGSATNERSNARTLDWNGNEVLAGKLTVGVGPTANMDVATKQYVDNSIPTVPTNISSFTNDSGYLTASDIASVMTYKGTKANYAALPSTGNTTGDVWHLTDTGAEWAWDGSTWQELGTAIDVSSFLTSETDPVFTASPAHGIAASDITNWNGKTAVSIVRW